MIDPRHYQAAIDWHTEQMNAAPDYTPVQGSVGRTNQISNIAHQSIKGLPMQRIIELARKIKCCSRLVSLQAAIDDNEEIDLINELIFALNDSWGLLALQTKANAHEEIMARAELIKIFKLNSN